MLYVRTSSPPKLATINAGQLQQVQDFVAWVQKKYQALYWPYRTLTEFERELRQHLTDEIHARLKLSTAKPVETEAAKSAKNTTVKKAAGQKKPRAKPSLKSRLPIPTVPRRITDADRGAFARKALTTALREFRRAAKEFNASHPHAEIKVKQEGKDTFIALGEANGKQVVTARVRLEAQSWGSSWMLHYETGHQNFSFHGTIHYQKEVSVGTTDDGSTLDSLAYWGAYDVFPDGRNRTDKSARVFPTYRLSRSLRAPLANNPRAGRQFRRF
jgi:hypothetical protein